MLKRKSSGQVARLLERSPHPRYLNHEMVTARAETFCQTVQPGFSGDLKLTLNPGQTVTFEVAHDVFRGHTAGEAVDGAWLAYYAAHGRPQVSAI